MSLDDLVVAVSNLAIDRGSRAVKYPPRLLRSFIGLKQEAAVRIFVEDALHSRRLQVGDWPLLLNQRSLDMTGYLARHGLGQPAR